MPALSFYRYRINRRTLKRQQTDQAFLGGFLHLWGTNSQGEVRGKCFLTQRLLHPQTCILRVQDYVWVVSWILEGLVPKCCLACYLCDAGESWSMKVIYRCLGLGSQIFGGLDEQAMCVSLSKFRLCFYLRTKILDLRVFLWFRKYQGRFLISSQGGFRCQM